MKFGLNSVDLRRGPRELIREGKFAHAYPILKAGGLEFVLKILKPGGSGGRINSLGPPR